MTSKVTRATRRAAATRAAIVEAAEELLAEGGPSALTLEAVAERADVAMQTVYNRVGGRSAVLIAVAERALEDNRQYMDAAYATPGTPRNASGPPQPPTPASPPNDRTSSACSPTRPTNRPRSNVSPTSSKSRTPNSPQR